jgi:nucleotide-binding universal stress UspA family protein
MKYLVPIDASQASLAPLEHLERAARRGAEVEVVMLNVQPRFHRHVSQFTRKADREALRAERSRAAMAQAIEKMSRTTIPFRAMAETGEPAERIAAVAASEGVDEILIGVGRHPAWLRWLNPSVAQQILARTDVPVTVFARGRQSTLERYAIPAGVASLAALLVAVD